MGEPLLTSSSPPRPMNQPDLLFSKYDLTNFSSSLLQSCNLFTQKIHGEGLLCPRYSSGFENKNEQGM